MCALLVSPKRHAMPKYANSCANAAPHADLSKKKSVTNQSNATTTQELQKSMNIAIPPGTPARPYPRHLVPLRTSEGFTALKNAESVVGFHSAAPVFQGQGPLQCGPTSLAIALNALKLVDPRKSSYRLHFDKDNIVEVLRSQLHPSHRFFSVSLDEIGKLAKQYIDLISSSRVRVSTVRTNETTCEKFREKAAIALGNGGIVVVNFSRAHIGYSTSPFAGHMSPIVAYNKDIDSFLLMDVAIRSWEPVWVPASLLFDAMNTNSKPRDPTQDYTLRKRGFIVFERI